MKKRLLIVFINLTFLCASGTPTNTTIAGFSMPDTLHEVTLKYNTVGNLILLPVTINDTIRVNLILDTGCRNLVLFGRRFNKLFEMQADRTVQFSGLGSGKPVVGTLSLGNKVSIGAVIGRKIPLVVVPGQNLFGPHADVDGVIGYDIFIKFEVELQLARQLITFRPASTRELSSEYERIAIRVEDSLPVVQSTIFFSGKQGHPCDLILDTGSSLGLLVKTCDLEKFPSQIQKRVIGRGLNGNISGIETEAERLLLDGVEMKALHAGIIYSGYRNQASVGMEILTGFDIVINYCKAYAGFRKLT